MKSIRSKLILVYNLVLFVAAIILYFIIPILLNYGEGTVNTSFDKDISGGLYYYQQIILIVAGISVLLTGTLCYALKDIDKFKLFKQKWEETRRYNIQK